MVPTLVFTDNGSTVLVTGSSIAPSVVMDKLEYQLVRLPSNYIQLVPTVAGATDIGKFGWGNVISPATANIDALYAALESIFTITPVDYATSALQTAGNATLVSILAEVIRELVSAEVTAATDAIVSKSILYGRNDAGYYTSIPATTEGHLEVAIHSPLLPFGSVHAEKLTPIFQSDAVYGINSQQELTTVSGSGAATVTDGMFTVSTGVTIYSQGVITSRKRARYRAGQGLVLRVTGKFSTPVADSYQVIGFGHGEDGIFFGYKNLEFGILYSHHGVRECRTLTITTASTTAENVTVTLNGVANLVAVTNSANIQRTVWELSLGTYVGWDAYPAGATVVFVKKSVGANAGAFTLTASTAVGTFALTKAGVASTDEFVAQTAWNGDRMLFGTDPTNSPSGVTLNPLSGQIAQFGLQYLGFGSFAVQLEYCPADGNNAVFSTVHTFRNPNSKTMPTFGNPSFPFTMAAYSAGSTTNLTVQAGSFGAFVEGSKMLHGPRFSYENSITTTTAAAYQCLFTVMNTRQYGGRANQVVINIISITGAVKHTQPVTIYLIKNGTLLGNPNFQPRSSNSSSLYDTAATTVTFAAGDQLIWVGQLGETGSFDHHFGNGDMNAEEVTLQPGEWITVAAKASTGTPAYTLASLNTREDQ